MAGREGDMYMAGYEDEAEFDRFAAGFHLNGAEVNSPYLVLAGEDDEQTTPFCSCSCMSQRVSIPLLWVLSFLLYPSFTAFRTVTKLTRP
jgi:hypothetical protein